MAWTKVLMDGDPITDLTGTAYRTLFLNSTGAVAELAHGSSGQVLESAGASADPIWATPSAAAHALDAGQTDVTITTPADDEVLSYETGTWINKTAAEAGLMTSGAAPNTHNLAGSEHNSDTLTNLNAKISDATLDDSSDTRTPSAGSVGNTEIDGSATDIAFAQLILTPTASGAGTTKGSVFYDSTDDHLYVYTV